jgi:hypothetical protein
VVPIGLTNGLAVRIGISACALSTFLLIVSIQLGMPPAVAIIWFIAAGFFAVSQYVRRTGQTLTTLSGARLGWISGLFLFALFTIFFSIFYSMLSDPTFMDALREQWKATQHTEAELNERLEMMRTPAQFLIAVVSMFLSLTTLPAIGGAVGAKLFGRRS